MSTPTDTVMPAPRMRAPFQLPEQPIRVDLMAKYFRAFGDPTRLQILRLLAEAERSVGELVAETGQAQPKVSNHLACLRWCGFVVGRREHRCVFYAIADPRVVEMLELAGGLLEQNAGHVACCGVIDGEAG
jgi:ArsR family transcriptional regulator, cadmium/lead-responsive transcriptional repressor